MEIKIYNSFREIEVQNIKDVKQTNLWIPLSQSKYIYSQLFAFGMVMISEKEPWHISMAMSPAEFSFYMPQKGVDQSKDRKGL